MEYGARYYKLGDENDIVNLLELVYGGWPKFDLQCSPLEHWRWKYKNSLNGPHIAVAESNGEIVGCLHTIQMRIKAGEKEVLGSQGADLAVHDNYRRMGIYNKLNDLLGDFVLNYSVSGNSVVFKKEIRLGCEPFPKPIDQMIFIFDVEKQLKLSNIENDLFKKYGFKTLKYFYKSIDKINKKKPKNINYEIKIMNKFDVKINELWEKIKNRYDYILIRDYDYLNWRFSPEGGNYIIHIIYEEQQIMGYYVTRINKYNKNHPVGYIVDALVNIDEETILKVLFEDAIKYFKENGVNIIHYWCVKNSPLMRNARKVGFVSAPNNYHVWFDPRGSFKMDFLKKVPSDRLHFSLGDTDWI